MKLRSLLLVAAPVLVLSACATQVPPQGTSPDAPDTGAALGVTWPDPPTGEVIGQGTVMDVAGTVELCLGAVAESWPPQCSGIPLTGWSWDGLDGSESEGDVRWGSYAVQGTYDGDSFAVTQPPIMLALYDPMMPEDPTGGVPGDTDEEQLVRIQDELPALLGAELLGSWPQDGRLWVQVLWDDGTWQSAADDDYGVDVVVIQSALRPVG
ncbi:hypothetical protein [Microbacterium sp. bgisy189]|uniref:hypothetical protein n=1 Tax=Microbacterium sp. bgisy189 TaxID=3413798 RepID=UPI003EB8AE8E